MKKILALILALAVALTFVACGKKAANEVETDIESQVETENTETPADTGEEKEDTEDKAEDKSEAQPETKPATSQKPQQPTTSTKPQTNTAKPEEKPATTPETKPEAKPESKPETKPEELPEEKPQASTPATLGNTLLADFKAKASSGDVVAIAEALLQNSAIKFSGGAMPVEPGLLSGFGNTEITGFKSGAVFMPMIGSIPFVGYVFELENAADVSSFISKLKSSADLRWNICVEAEEMVTGSVGTKVFFVMCPTSLED